jgi:ParB family chromosome partitioning protein
VQGQVEEGVLTFGHARALLPLEDPQTILKAAQKVKALSMSVRQTESYVQKLLSPAPAGQAGEQKEKQIDPNVREVQESLQRALGLKVRIEDKKGRGRVIIEYGQLEEFDRLLERLRR